MSMTFARLLDPCFEDDDDPFRHYDYRGEPLEDRLYLPCGIDPHKKVCHAAFVHPLPHRQDILSHRQVQNQHLPDALWLVEEGLHQLPFPQHLNEIPYFGPVVTATFLAELGWPFWYRTVDSVVAWFGLDPSVSESADHTTGISHLTKRGTKYGRRMIWLVARNWSRYVPQGRRMYRKERDENKLSYDGAICVIAAKLVRIAFAMARDGSHFDMDTAFPS